MAIICQLHQFVGKNKFLIKGLSSNQKNRQIVIMDKYIFIKKTGKIKYWNEQRKPIKL